MGWERAKPTIAELSNPPSCGWWLMIGILMLILGALLFILHASGTVKLLSFINIWWLTLTPGGVWLILFSLRGWLWANEIDEHQFQLKEAEYAQQAWENWASRHLTVLGCSVLLPHDVNADNILRENTNIPPQYKLSNRIDSVLPVEDIWVKRCLAAIQEAVNALPQDLPLSVTLLTDSPEHEALRAAFATDWVSTFSDRMIPADISIARALPIAWVESRLKEPGLTVDLILVLQLHGHEDYSDGLASLLLTSDDLAQKYGLSYTSRLLRPMPLDKNNINNELSLFLDTQTIACRTSRICCDQQAWRDVLAVLLTQAAKRETIWQSSQVLILERWMGNPGPAGAWLLMALAADIVDRNDTSLLVMMASESEHFISSVIPGIQNG
ncbi:type VI secretion protein [Cronobacter dublinensis]|uniref:type VI secretion protein n=1 Tax=Cronobacter dublinensis TaxID=413497 RepID=UPI000D000A6C|nr:type VI secretion protein [Cronobacter dublinensis]